MVVVSEMKEISTDGRHVGDETNFEELCSRLVGESVQRRVWGLICG